jgi:uncharacterized protein (TIGR03084 family)
MTDLREIVADLRAEQDALDVVVADLSDEQWRLPTPSPGWTVADQIGHLTYFDGAAALAISDPEAFAASRDQLERAGDGVDALTLRRGTPPGELLAGWRANRGRLADAAATVRDGQRVDWYGPSMSAKSFFTARLMECWAHGQDIVDAVGAVRPATDRLRHVAQLGVITRGWSYLNRGLPVPEQEVRVDLAAPSGATWTWGPGTAADSVRGSALDFCLVVTQRRHVDDTRLEVTGEGARDWLEKAQAFAGRATDGPRPGGRAQ